MTGYGDLYELDENVDLSTTASWVDGSTGAGSASESNGELTMQGNDASNRGIISKTVTEELDQELHIKCHLRCLMLQQMEKLVLIPMMEQMMF